MADSQMSRLDHLQAMVDGAQTRMLVKGCSDQNFAVLGRFRRDLLAEIEELGGVRPTRQETGLSEFETRFAARRTAPKATRRAKSG